MPFLRFTFVCFVAWLSALAPLGAAEPVNGAAEARAEMVRIVELEIEALGPITGIGKIDPAILEVMREMPRHAFVPAPFTPFAYRRHPLPVGHDQNIAAPFLVALMTHLIEPEPDDVVFETGTGAGYHAAVLSRLVGQVRSVELVEPLARRAADLLAGLGYDNVLVRPGDGYDGWPEEGPYDAIVVKEAIDHVPPPLLAQLKPGGRMVLPLGPGRGPQYLTVVTKDQAGRTLEQRIMPVRFSPFQGGQRL